MSTEPLLSELESAKRTGVSVETLRDYTRFGFLESVSQGSEVYFREKDLDNVFSSGDVLPSFAQTMSEPEPEPETLPETLIEQVQVSEESVASTPSFSETVDQIRRLREGTSLSPESSSSEAEESGVADKEASSDSQSHYSEVIAVNRRLREEVESLKEDRDWLRGRLEKLEARMERDQMLLLSESETIRRLVGRDNKRSFWSFALPWLNPPKGGPEVSG